ncbi:ABC transporter ATP-binding protein [Cohnella lubricantis]|uniref:ABC transporter ATP-binding protein n=1 Tax=Cohnella lubricantis TaxID=2163172 RepID=A0A841TCX6_9BACL|nr:ABC transporter ATP-binding protein [Cohnella lubricantis]MBB6676827.1 ABC transporter ATP-binding protein [Cohnella lubricantis]MBP2119406.1 ATP-binding cassette subfamily C protein [Cohnella lubricantis]
MRAVLYFTKRLRKFAGGLLYFHLIGTVLSGFLEGIGIFLLVPMIGMTGMADIDAGRIPLAGLFAPLRDIPQNWALPAVLGIFLALSVGQGLLKRSNSIVGVKLHHSFVNRLREDTHRDLLGSNWSFFVRSRKSDLVHSLTTEIGKVSGGVTHSLQLLASLLFTAIQIGLAFWLSAPLTLFVIFSGILLVLMSRGFVARSRKLGSRTVELSRQFMAGLTDQMNGIKDIKTNMLEPSRVGWLKRISSDIYDEQIAYAKLRSASQFSYQAASAVLIAAFLLLSTKLLHSGLEQLVVIVLIFSRLWPRFSGIQSSLEHIASAVPSLERILVLRQECLDARDLRGGEPAETDSAATEAWRLEQGVECRGVCFRYRQDDERYVLQNVDLLFPARQMTAIIGSSGAGKSTLADLVMGLVRPERGQILVDGVQLEGKRLQSFRRSIGYVPQDPYLFNDTIRENLLLVNPKASDEEIWAALDFSASAEFVRKLPQGLDTPIGDRGIRLSGGERQRLVLARAILRKPAILVLDEATSALDADNEAKIQEAIDRLKGTMTIIVIAHRLSTIRNADQIVAVEQGRVVRQSKSILLAAGG